MREALFVGCGGFVGALLRYGITRALGSTSLPRSALLVNVLGSFFLGYLFSISERDGIAPEHRAALGTGLLGALTTFSTFSVETLSLIHAGAFGAASANVFMNVAFSLSAAAIGLIAGR